MKGCYSSRVHANACTALTFAPMDGNSLNSLEQQILMDGIYIGLLLCKDEHLSRKANSSHRVFLQPYPSTQFLLPSSLSWDSGTSLDWLHSQEEESSAGTQAGIPSWPLPSRILPPVRHRPGQVISRLGSPAIALPQKGGLLI